MTFQVLIQRTSDQATRVVDAGQWRAEDDASEWYWTEGNMGCDCNLALQFGDIAAACGHDAYRVIEFRLADGTTIPCQPLLA